MFYFLFFPQFFFHSCVLLLVVLGKANANPDHPDYVPSIFNFTKADTAKNTQKVMKFSNLYQRNIEKSKHLEVSKKIIVCCSAENKINVEPVFSPPTSQKPPENFDFNIYCSLTDDISKTPTKPQQKEVSMVASTPYKILLATACNTSQTIEVLINLSLISSTPIKTNTDIKNPITNVSNDESSTLHSMNCMEIDFLRKEKIDLQFRIQCLEEKIIKTEILYYVPFAMTLK